MSYCLATRDVLHQTHLQERKIEATALRRLAEECAVNLSVSPGMQLVVERGLPPVLLQPTFVICIGGGQVRVPWRNATTLLRNGGICEGSINFP